MTSSYFGLETEENKTNLAVNNYPTVTGFLLRSDVVSGWPGLLVDGYNEDDTKKIELLRMERLSASGLKLRAQNKDDAASLVHDESQLCVCIVHCTLYNLRNY